MTLKWLHLGCRILLTKQRVYSMVQRDTQTLIKPIRNLLEQYLIISVEYLENIPKHPGRSL